MRAEDLLDVIGEVDDEMIKDAKKKSPALPRWTGIVAAAACLALVTVGALSAFSHRGRLLTDAAKSAEMPMMAENAAVAEEAAEEAAPLMDNAMTFAFEESAPLPAPLEEPAAFEEAEAEEAAPTEDAGAACSFSAEEIAAFFPSAAEKNGAATNQYSEVYARKLSELCEPLPTEREELAVFSMNYEKPDPEQARAFFEEQLPFMRELTDVSSGEYSEEEMTDAYGNALIYATLWEEHLPEDGEDDSAWDFGFINLTAGRNLYSVSASKNTPLTLKGEFAALPADASDEEIEIALADSIGYLRERFGADCSELKIVRSYDYDKLSSVSVFLYDDTGHAGPDVLDGAPVADRCIRLTFFTDWGEGSAHDWSRFTKDGLLLGELSFSAAISPRDESYAEIGGSRILSLEEAEEMLAKGWVFGGHSCPLCMAEQEKIDFSDYDGVSIEYVHGQDELLYVPFYAFYKSLGENAFGMPVFAKTYVCAAEVSGLEEYFEGQKAEHPG